MAVAHAALARIVNAPAAAAAAQQSNFNQVVDDMNSSYENVILTLQKELPSYSMPAGHFLIVNLQGLIHAIHDFKMTQQPQSAYNLIKKLVYNLKLIVKIFYTFHIK